MTNDQSDWIYTAVPGGLDLIEWFGQMPGFHDAEVLSLHLHRKGQSELRLHGWIMTGMVGDDGHLKLEKHAVVTFTLEGIMDMQLEGFGLQNVIYGLDLRHAPDRPERRGYLTLPPLPDDIEIEIHHC